MAPTNLMKRLRDLLARHPAAKPLAAGVLLGLVLFPAIGGLASYTDSNTFCVSCHEMAAAPYQEYLESIHYRNRTGIRAGCADCHLPHNSWFAYAKAKIIASKDVYHHLIGTLATSEDFEARRMEMAARVWQDLKTTDSAACRSCHDGAAMDPQLQGSGDMHQRALGMGRTCVDCHRGVAHQIR